MNTSVEIIYSSFGSQLASTSWDPPKGKTIKNNNLESRESIQQEKRNDHILIRN